jgi:hypothetical protein
MIEISVHESPPDGARVDLRVPASLVRVAGALAPRVRLAADDAELEGAMLAIRAGLEAVAASPDAVFVAVDEPGSRVRIAKKDGFLLVEVDDGGDRVRVSVPPVAVRVLTEIVPRLAGAVPDPV